jgi:hypothetical protein
MDCNFSFYNTKWYKQTKFLDIKKKRNILSLTGLVNKNKNKNNKNKNKNKKIKIKIIKNK